MRFEEAVSALPWSIAHKTCWLRHKDIFLYSILDHGPAVQSLDNFIHSVNPYPVDKIGALFILIGQHLLDRDLSAG